MKLARPLILDFDSTIVSVEGLDELARMSLGEQQGYETILENLLEITRQGMEGKISFRESLQKRLEQLSCTRNQVMELGEKLKSLISPSFLQNKEFLRTNRNSIYVFSGGFREYIIPVCIFLGLREDQIFANTFVFQADGRLHGYDTQAILAQDRGKVKQLLALPLIGKVDVIGDGMTDYEMTESGRVERFFVFTENIERKSVLEKAKYSIATFDGYLAQL